MEVVGVRRAMTAFQSVYHPSMLPAGIDRIGRCNTCDLMAF